MQTKWKLAQTLAGSPSCKRCLCTWRPTLVSADVAAALCHPFDSD